jgi:nitrate reductase gamma subunit
MFALFFAVAGFACGLYFAVVPFIVLMLISAIGYAAFEYFGGETVSAIDLGIAIVACQAGYFLAVVFRVLQRKRRSQGATPDAGKTASHQGNATRR